MSYMDGFEIHPHPNTPASAVKSLAGFATSIVSDIMGGRLVGSSRSEEHTSELQSH